MTVASDIVQDERNTPPQDLYAEQSVLGAMLIDRDAVEKALDILEPEDFYRNSHGVIFTAMRNVAAQGEAVDLVTVRAELDRMRALEQTGGVSYQASLADLVPSVSNVGHYASIVFRLSQLRRMCEAGQRVAQWCYDRDGDVLALIDKCEAEVLRVGERREPGTLDGVAAQRRMFDRNVAGNTGLDWSMEILNHFAGAMSDEEPTVVGGKSGDGKSMLARDEVRHKCKQGLGVGVFSLELSEDKFRERLLAAEMGLSVRALRAGMRQPATVWMKDGSCARMNDEIGQWPLIVDERSSLTVTQIAARARRMKRELAKRGTPLSLLIIDYAGLIEAEGTSDYARSKRAAQQVRAMVKDLRVPCIVLTQVTMDGDKRAPAEGKKQDLAAFPKVHTRDAKDWYHVASIVVWLRRPAEDCDPGTYDHENWKNRALAWVEKNRDGGGQGVVEIGWRDGVGGFTDPKQMPERAMPVQFAEQDEEEYQPYYGDPFKDD